MLAKNLLLNYARLLVRKLLHLLLPEIQGFPIRAEVNLVEMMGNELIVYLETPDDAEFVARLDPRARVGRGETLDLLFDTQRIYLFDREMETVIC